jgi:hypothetical protein
MVWDNTIKPNGGCTTDFWDLFYYSIITQATVGYGDIVPCGQASRILTICQVSFGTVFSAVGFALVVLKFVERRHNLRFAKRVCYDPKNHQLVIWAWNQDAHSLFDLHTTIGVEKYVSPDVDSVVRVKRFPLQVYKEPVFVPPMLGIILRTSCCTISNPAQPPVASSTQGSFMTIVTRDEHGQLLLQGGKLFVEIRATVAELLKPVFFQKSYVFDEIACGHFKELSDGPFPANWRYRKFGRFGKMVYTKPAECASCILHAECPLKSDVVDGLFWRRRWQPRYYQ